MREIQVYEKYTKYKSSLQKKKFLSLKSRAEGYVVVWIGEMKMYKTGSQRAAGPPSTYIQSRIICFLREYIYSINIKYINFQPYPYP